MYSKKMWTMLPHSSEFDLPLIETKLWLNRKSARRGQAISVDRMVASRITFFLPPIMFSTTVSISVSLTLCSSGLIELYPSTQLETFPLSSVDTMLRAMVYRSSYSETAHEYGRRAISNDRDLQVLHQV